MDGIELLQRGCIGRFGVHADGDGDSYVVPVAYACVGSRLVTRLSPGRKLDLLRRAPDSACFEVDSIDIEGRCHRVLAWGPVRELRGLDAERALAKILSVTATPADDVLPASWVDQGSRQPRASPSVIELHVMRTDVLVNPERPSCSHRALVRRKDHQ